MMMESITVVSYTYRKCAKYHHMTNYLHCALFEKIIKPFPQMTLYTTLRRLQLNFVSSIYVSSI